MNEARADLGPWLARWQASYPRLTGWVEDHIEQTCTFYRLPQQHIMFRDNQDENVATIKMRKPMSRGWGGRA